MNNPLNTPIKIAVAIAGVALLAALAFAGFMTLRDHQRAQRIVDLQNEVARRDTTIETQKGLYQKLAIQGTDLQNLLDGKDQQLKELQDQLKKSGDQLLAANSVIVQLKKDLKSATGTVTVLPADPKDPLKIVSHYDSGTDFDPFQIYVDNKTDCSLKDKPIYSVTMHQFKPLKISVAVSQLKDGSWRASTTSSSENFSLDIGLAAVNPYLLEEKWYEKIDFALEAGIGTSPGLLLGLGADIEIGKFDLGPRVWGVIDTHGASPYFGASLAWHPFKKVR